MPQNLKVIYTQGVPIAADFNASDGAPICVNVLSGRLYYLAAGGGVTEIAPPTGGGTVTSVSFTGGLISVGTPTTTPALTVAGTSGGIPYFSSSSAWASSGALAQGGIVCGGGAGATPTSVTAGATTTILVGGGANTNPVWTAATGTGAPVRADAPTGTGNWTIPTINLTGGQIAFPATQAASAGANTLDDYEEGTFTATLAGSSTAGTQTYATQAGLYVKVGQLVVCTIQTALSAKDAATAGNIVLRTLPFTSNTTAGTINGMAIGYHMAFDLDVAGGYYQLTGLLLPNTTQIELRECGDNVTVANLVAADFGASSAIAGTISYRASA